MFLPDNDEDISSTAFLHLSLFFHHTMSQKKIGTALYTSFYHVFKR